ncbi:MAG: protein translocase subunit SecD [Solirubrobacterales bacterium]|nr:protein translocase subunit SecD [Solirubrobacterales bacterium]
MTDRRRNVLILLVVAGLIAASAVVIALRPTVLGLDLKGGVELVYQATPTPQQPTITPDSMKRAVDVMDNRVNQLGVSQPSISTEGKDLIDVQLPNVSNVQQAESQVGNTARLAFYDWEANVLAPPAKGTHGAPITVAKGLTTQDPQSEQIYSGNGAGGTPGSLNLYDAVQLASKQKAWKSKHNARTGTEYFLFGSPGSAACKAAAATAKTKTPKGQHCLITGPVQPVGSQTVHQAVYSGLTPAETKGTQLIGVKQGWVVMQGTPASFAPGKWPKYGSVNAGYFVLRDNAAVFGNDIKNPQSQTSQGTPAVTFSFTSLGAKEFQGVTAAIANRGSLASVGSTKINEHFAAALDDQLLSVASIDWKSYPDGIDGSQGAQISGNFTASSAGSLASQLRLGALPVKLNRISENAVSATLGAQALHQGLVAGLIGLAVVALFLLFYYRLLGLIAVGGLVVYGVYLFALIKAIPITMTLAGIAGMILTIGVAADANIVIFERVKEEIRAGHSVRQGILHGYKKGLSAIIDANVVTVLTAFILFVLATQDVKGFAFTLGIGTFVSLFTAVMATQAIMMTVGSTRSLGRAEALGAGGKKRVWRTDFMGLSRYFFSLSGVILLVGALAIGGRGLNLGIDFTSGSQINVGLKQAASVNQVKSVLSSVGAGDARVQAVHGDSALGKNGFQIASKYLTAPKYAQLRSELDSKFGIATNKSGNQDLSNNSVGPTFGSSVANSAVIAIIASLIVICAYVALRFEWKYAVPVLIALAHDLLISIGVYALLGRVVTTDTVAALLTILGYSMYDTIIVFDRVRENTKRMPRAAFSQIVNRSMSEVLTRSLATTACTLLPVIALLAFGGSTLKDFAFALLVGVASGAYSSIFIASPVLTHWKEREHGFKLRRERIIAQEGHVPAYAADSADVEPAKPKRRSGRLTTPDDNVSRSEFEQMKDELGLDEEAPAHGTSRLTRRTATVDADGSSEEQAKRQRSERAAKARAERAEQARAAEEAAAQAPESASAASDPVPEDEQFEHAPDAVDVDLPEEKPKPKRSPNARPGKRKHGRR